MLPTKVICNSMSYKYAAEASKHGQHEQGRDPPEPLRLEDNARRSLIGTRPSPTCNPWQNMRNASRGLDSYLRRNSVGSGAHCEKVQQEVGAHEGRHYALPVSAIDVVHLLAANSSSQQILRSEIWRGT